LTIFPSWRIDCRLSGQSETDNRKSAIGRLKERNSMTTLIQDLRYGLRMLARSPGFTAVAVLTLALGIGANTAIFSVVDAVLIRPLPYKDAGRLVMVFENEPQLQTAPVSPPDFFDWRDQNHVFDAMAAGTEDSGTLTGVGEPERLEIGPVSANLFEMLAARPLLGRFFRADEDQPGHNLVVILSHPLWQGKFGSDPKVIGRKIALDGTLCEVVGVMPAEFRFPPIWGDRPQLWIPLGLPRTEESRGGHMLWVMARLEPGISPEKARAEMETIAARLAKEHPATNANIGVNLLPLRNYFTRGFRHTLLVLFGAVGFVLLIACSNVANLFIARATARAREIAVRATLGASRARVIRQLLTESLALAVGGGLAGILFADWTRDLLLDLSPYDYLKSSGGAGLDLTVLGFTGALSLLTGVIFGLVPALQASRVQLSETLKEGARAAAPGTRTRRFRSALVVAEVSLALVLMVGAGLMLRSLWALLNVDPGFDPRNALTMGIELPDARYPKEDQQINFFQRLLEKIQVLPGVQAASATSQLPLQGGPNGRIMVEGRPSRPDFSGPLVQPTSVTVRYFKTMGISLLRGRFFTEADRANAPKVVVINEKLAQQYFPNEDPIGKRVSQPGDKPDWREIVGIIKDVHEWGLDEEPIAEVYFPFDQMPRAAMSLVIKTRTSNPESLANAARAQVADLDKDLAVFDLNTMPQVISNRAMDSRFRAALVGLFGALAMVLSAIGIYGVIAYSVNQRTHEIGIRLALGAERRDVLRMVLREGSKMVLLGVAIGLGGALGLTRLMAGMLFGVSAHDPLTLAGVAGLLVLVALLACYLPARRATKVDPMVALRYE
jgi:putative ABC transport system permease protein